MTEVFNFGSLILRSFSFFFFAISSKEVWWYREEGNLSWVFVCESRRLFMIWFFFRNWRRIEIFNLSSEAELLERRMTRWKHDEIEITRIIYLTLIIFYSKEILIDNFSMLTIQIIYLRQYMYCHFNKKKPLTFYIICTKQSQLIQIEIQEQLDAA